MQVAPKRAPPPPAGPVANPSEPEGLFNTLGELEEKKRKIEQLAAMLNISLDA
jgi:hypothetical protein